MSGEDPSQRGSESPRQTPITKSVTISEEPETITPQLDKAESPPTLKKHRASTSGKRLTGRPAANLSSTSIHSISSQISQLDLDSPKDEASRSGDHDSLLSQVAAWLQEERIRRKPRPTYSKHGDGSSPRQSPHQRSRSDSQSSENAIALDKLESILSKYAAAGKEGSAALGLGQSKRASLSRRKHSISQKLKRLSLPASSDTEYVDGDILVPNVDAVLDNTKTLSYGGGQGDSERRSKERQNWITFKQDIVRLAHTLRLKGWRRIPIENGGEIDVERLSGALTNAVYVVSPPEVMPEDPNVQDRPHTSKKPPAKLLLRVYGPQVEHLIDRDAELAILRRLCRKRIGPRMLGTFKNGRFEEYFHARALTPEELRDPSTSKQIAKRTRELHDGIELLEEERDKGAFVFRNWNSWVDRCEQVITWLDQQVLSPEPLPSVKQASWHKRGLVLGVEWPIFRKVFDLARNYLVDYYGGENGLRERLVFSHNDTQYGNLLRMTPSGESPLLLPANSHKQLIVIDFEYSSANLPANEFANHFTEWCYNYHHPLYPYRCTTAAYPTPEEQHRFIRAYVDHRPQFHLTTPSATPKLASSSPSPGLPATQSGPSMSGSSSISAFMLDSRAPPGGYPSPGCHPNYEAEEKAREEATEKQVQQLMKEARMWRLANSAQWTAWGIVQAKLPEEFEGRQKDDGEEDPATEASAGVAISDPLSSDVKQKAEDAKHDRPETRKHEDEHHLGDDPKLQGMTGATDNSVASPTVTTTATPADKKFTEKQKSATTEPESASHGTGVHSAAEPDETATEDGEESEEFDYLAYAQDRALFFWGDVLELGLVKEDELPQELLKMVKRVPY